MKPTRRPPPAPEAPSRRIAATHKTLPDDEKHASGLFCVRDRDWEHVWAANVSWAKATEVKERVSGRKLSKTVRIEEMPDDPELVAVCLRADYIGRTIKVTPAIQEALDILDGRPPPSVQAQAEKRRREEAARKAAAEVAKKAAAKARARVVAVPDPEPELEEDLGAGADDDAGEGDELADELDEAPMDEIMGTGT